MSALAHVGHAVSDIDRSARFYTELFGFRFDRELSFQPEQIVELLQLDTPCSVRVIYLSLGDFTLELMQFDPASSEAARSRVFNQTGLTHLSLVVDDPDDVFSRVAEFGGSQVSSVGSAHMIRDPDGQLIELLPPTYPEGVEAQRRAQAVQS